MNWKFIPEKQRIQFFTDSNPNGGVGFSLTAEEEVEINSRKNIEAALAVDLSRASHNVKSFIASCVVNRGLDLDLNDQRHNEHFDEFISTPNGETPSHQSDHLQTLVFCLNSQLKKACTEAEENGLRLFVDFSYDNCRKHFRAEAAYLKLFLAQ